MEQSFVAPEPMIALDHYQFRSGGRQLKLFGILAIVLFFLTIGTLLGAVPIIEAMFDAYAANDQAKALRLVHYSEIIQQCAPLIFVFMIGAWASFFTAMYGPRKAMTGLGRSDWKYLFSTTVVSILIPFWSFYRPWVGLAEIDKAVASAARHGRLTDDWRDGFSVPTFILAFVVIVVGIFSFIGGREKELDPRTPEQITEALTNAEMSLIVVGGVVSLVTLAVTFYLIRQMINLGKVKRAFNIA